MPHGPAHRVRLAGRADDHDVAVVARGAQPRDDVEAEDVRQVQVEQDQVGPQLPDGRERLLPGAGDPDDPERLDPVDERPVDAGHHEVVVDHEHADRGGGTGRLRGRGGRGGRTGRAARCRHGAAPSATASVRWLTVMRAVNMAPSGVLVTEISPP